MIPTDMFHRMTTQQAASNYALMLKPFTYELLFGERYTNFKILDHSVGQPYKVSWCSCTQLPGHSRTHNKKVNTWPLQNHENKNYFQHK